MSDGIKRDIVRAVELLHDTRDPDGMAAIFEAFGRALSAVSQSEKTQVLVMIGAMLHRAPESALVAMHAEAAHQEDYNRVLRDAMAQQALDDAEHVEAA